MWALLGSVYRVLLRCPKTPVSIVALSQDPDSSLHGGEAVVLDSSSYGLTASPPSSLQIIVIGPRDKRLCVLIIYSQCESSVESQGDTTERGWCLRARRWRL